ncbi:cell division protein DedD [Photobacterium aquimaris]|uniref:Cell division protein DedD n=1 Tax=Photobacterium aquimaris TaxID=512643 RepID=A0A2T3HXJ9_9GAMM|nr:cell division protein DedD [Photobacterium aquimaris]MCP4954648.1 cell division protein DedD [Photobacterium aquimaris]OBU24902.1 cell division protein DedD [Photobacterium aquimaris]PQJ41646.1 cell division protein DedD [Photobacterium aquimaris]PSU04108.1 cell division protein DedD [Photobacterium aquimaris]
MASQFQNRLIGTIILVAIGVIFLPDFFDGKKEHYKEEFAGIPLQPKMGGQSEAKTIPEPENADVVLPKEPVTATTAQQASTSTNDETFTIENDHSATTNTAAKPKPVVAKPVVVKPTVKPSVTTPAVKKTAVASSAWVIKMGTFGNLDNANGLVAKLRLNGYQAQLIPANAKPGQLVKVVVGPDVSKAKLAGQIAELKKITGLNGKLNRFDAINP